MSRVVEEAQGRERKLVHVFDCEMGRITLGRGCELAPDMVMIKIPNFAGRGGFGGEVWIDTRQLAEKVESCYCIAPFDEQGREEMQALKSALNEVWPRSVEDWEDGFRRDPHCEREIAKWLHLAHHYKAVTLGKRLSQDEKMDYYNLFLACLNGPRRHVLKTVELKILSQPQAEEAMAKFYDDGAKPS